MARVLVRRTALVAMIVAMLVVAAATMTAAQSLQATRMQSVAVVGAGHGANATTVFPYSYNPSWFTSVTKPRGCLLVRVQNVTLPTNPSPGPSKMAVSCVTADGDPLLSFTDIAASDVVFEPTEPWEVKGTEDPRLALVGEMYYLFYTAVALAANGDWIARLSLATSPDPANATSWVRYGPLFPDANNFQFTKSGALLVNPSGPSYLIFGDCSLYNGLQVAVPDSTFKKYSVIEDFLLITKRKGMFDSYLVESGPPPMQLDDGNWLFIYNAAQMLEGVPNHLFYAPGYVILNGSNPLQVLQRADKPIVMPSYIWETQGLTPYVIFVEAMRYANATTSKNVFVAYYGAADTGVGALRVTVKSTGNPDMAYDVRSHRVHRRA